ncbi:hypothetical protein C0J52_18308 [Blattella germanica]|nr:hypothetical protein C0J52_18308 [Blattella germanica]
MTLPSSGFEHLLVARIGSPGIRSHRPPVGDLTQARSSQEFQPSNEDFYFWEANFALVSEVSVGCELINTRTLLDDHK